MEVAVYFPPNTLPPLLVPDLDDTVDYEGTLETSCGDGSYSSPATPWEFLRTEWVEDAAICEQDSVFQIERTVSGLSTPVRIMYDDTTGLVYGIDGDRPNGMFFMYDPDNLNSSADITYFPGILQQGATNFIFGNEADPVNRRLFAAGQDSDGIQVFDLATNSVSVIQWGCNHHIQPICGSSAVRNGYPRLFLKIIGNVLIGLDKYSWTMIQVDLATLNVNFIRSINDIPSGDRCLIGAPVMSVVNGEIWVMSSQASTNDSPNRTAHIYRYSMDFTQLIGTIDITQYTATWTYGSYVRNAFMDNQYQKFYIQDSGKNSLIRINALTLAIEDVQTIEMRLDRTNSAFGFIIDPITGELYMPGEFTNALSDTNPAYCTYKLDRVTGQRTQIYPGVNFSSLTRISLTNKLHGVNPGIPAWSSGAGWNTDGTISIFTR